ncbi:MAG: family intrarane metalloprotease [Mucilaginibacter sp.]|nr:family intrarane metalloprotease [Mucilaginibacter sp.]
MTDRPYNPIPHKQIHPALQFLIFMGMSVGVLIIGSFIGIAIILAVFGMHTVNDIMTLNVTSHQAQNALWILQLIGTTLPILLTPVFFAYVIVREPEDYLKTTFHFSWLLIVIVFLTMILSNPLIEFLGNINEKMVLPKFLKGVEDWMRDSENSAKKLSDSMMEMKTFASMLFDLIFIGLVTAIAEEFMFRGCLQTIFIRWMKNKHVAVWITAILFSAFHMEFFGFLPRLLLGVLFGYFTVWSGSVWPAVWAHFINNGTVVVVTYLFQHKLITLNPDESQSFSYAGYIISFIITLFLLFIYRYISNKRQIADINGEELD